MIYASHQHAVFGKKYEILLQYRNDIDGLRAIAVLAIVIFHINPTRLPGGFVGVDVFFVISGFLITTIITRELDQDRFSFAEFYAKRIRRLFPALFATLLVCWIVGFFVLLPPEFQKLGAASVATVFYLSNIYFYTQSGYFDDALESDPLVHTWSLGVEEQFYLLFPAALVALTRLGKPARNIGLLVIGAGSLLAAQLVLNFDPSAAFYLSPTRFWQFLIGAAVALAPALLVRRAWAEVLAFIGLCWVLAAIALYSSQTPFPGIAAALPTLGVGAIIYAGKARGTLVGKGLALPPIRYVGKISYSVYLWHWPIIVFYQLAVKAMPSALEQLMLLVAALGVGAASYSLIEHPTRAISIAMPKLVFATAALATTLVACVSVYVLSNSGFAYRYPSKVQHYAEYLDYINPPEKRLGICFLTSGSNAGAFQIDECTAKDPLKRNAVLIGDSHAAHFFTGLKNTYPDVHISQINASGCRPVLPLKGDPRCTDLLRRAFAEIIPSNAYDTVILSSRWQPGDGKGLGETIRNLLKTTSHVVVFGPIIEYKRPLPRLLAAAAIAGNSSPISEAKDQNQLAMIDREIRAAAADNGAEYVSVLDLICPAGVCQTTMPNDNPIQFDSSHLTAEASDEIVARMRARGLEL